jgi:hypothetical protein
MSHMQFVHGRYEQGREGASVPPYGDVGVLFAEESDVEEVSVVNCVDGERVNAGTLRLGEALVIVQADVSKAAPRRNAAHVEEAHELHGRAF